MNEIKIIGNLGRDPEMRYTGNGIPVLNFSLAFNERSKDGNVKTHWFKTLVWGDAAERISQSGLRKGQRVMVCGRILNNEWTDKEGAVRKETQIHANRVYPLAGREEAQESTQEAESSFFPEYS